MCTSTNSGQFDIQHRLIGFFYNRCGECSLRGTDGIFKYNCVKKTNLMHNLFLVYFVNLYMFLAYLGPSSGGTTVCIQRFVLIIFLEDCLFSWLTRKTGSHLKRTISTSCCIHTVVPPDDRPRHARNM